MLPSTDSETADNSEAEGTGTTGKEAIDTVNGKREAGEITISSTDKNSLPTLIMGDRPTMAIVLIPRGHSMAITSIVSILSDISLFRFTFFLRKSGGVGALKQIFLMCFGSTHLTKEPEISLMNEPFACACSPFCSFV